MGYHTEFQGQFNLNKKLDPATQEFLENFNKTRRMKRKGLDASYGVDGEFYCGKGPCGQDEEDNIVDYNSPPSTQPGLWCQWVPTPDGLYIEWDGGEKFYHYVEWIEYLIKKVLAPKGYVLNGVVYWQGEENQDTGKIVIKNNKVTTKEGRITYEPVRKRVKRSKLQQLALIDERIAKLQAQKKALKVV